MWKLPILEIGSVVAPVNYKFGKLAHTAVSGEFVYDYYGPKFDMESDILSNRDTETTSQGVNQHQTKANAPQTQNIFVYFYSDGAIG